MQLALKKSAPSNTTPWQRFACWVIKARLASEYCHGGIVIDGGNETLNFTLLPADFAGNVTLRDIATGVQTSNVLPIGAIFSGIMSIIRDKQ